MTWHCYKCTPHKAWCIGTHQGGLSICDRREFQVPCAFWQESFPGSLTYTAEWSSNPNSLSSQHSASVLPKRPWPGFFFLSHCLFFTISHHQKNVHLNSLQTVKLQDLCHCLNSQRDYSKHHWIKTCNAEAEKQLPGFSWSNCLRFMALQSEAQLGTAAIVGLDLARFGGHGNFHSLHSRGGMLYGWQYWSEAFSSPWGQSKNQFKRSFWVWITVWYVLIEWSVDIQTYNRAHSAEVKTLVLKTFQGRGSLLGNSQLAETCFCSFICLLVRKNVCQYLTYILKQLEVCMWVSTEAKASQVNFSQQISLAKPLKITMATKQRRMRIWKTPIYVLGLMVED